MKNIFSKKNSGKTNRNNKENAPVITCTSCGKDVLEELARTNSSVCPFCGMDFRMRAKDRIKQIADRGSFTEMDADMTSVDTLHFPSYKAKLKKSMKVSGLSEAIITGICTLGGVKTAIAVMDSQFMMGSMGAVVGQKIVNLTQRATSEKLPLVIFCASGGARMQEGMLSLTQMSRCSVAMNMHSAAGLLYISVLTHPTTGGVTASFAMQGDIILAEPKVLIGFAGPRVIAQTVKEVLPDGFQRSEYLLKHGMLDAIVKRSDMKSTLSNLVKLHIPKVEVNL